MGSRETFVLWRLGSVTFKLFSHRCLALSTVVTAVNGLLGAPPNSWILAEMLAKWSGWNLTNPTGDYGPGKQILHSCLWSSLLVLLNLCQIIVWWLTARKTFYQLFLLLGAWFSFHDICELCNHRKHMTYLIGFIGILLAITQFLN